MTGDKPWKIKRQEGALWPRHKVEGVRKGELNSTQVWGFLIISPLVKVSVWELCLNRRETCLLPLLTASIRPNEALIGGVGCCSLEKHRVSKVQRRWQQWAGCQWPKWPFVWTVCSAITSKARWQHIHQISMENVKGHLNAFVCRFSFFPSGD